MKTEFIKAVDFSQEVKGKLQKLHHDHGDWHRAVDSMRTMIFRFALAYLRSERIEGETKRYRNGAGFHLYSLFNFCDDMESYIVDSKKTFCEIRSQILGEESREIRRTITDIYLDYIRDPLFVTEDQQARISAAFIIDILNDILRELELLQEQEEE